MRAGPSGWGGQDGRQWMPCHRLCVWDGDQRGPSVGVPGRGGVLGVSLINLRSKYKAGEKATKERCW